MEIYIDNVAQYNESYIVELIEDYFHLGKVDSVICKDAYINNERIRGATITFEDIFHNFNTHIMKREILYHKPFILQIKDKKELLTVYKTIDEYKFYSKKKTNKEYVKIYKYIYNPIEG